MHSILPSLLKFFLFIALASPAFGTELLALNERSLFDLREGRDGLEFNFKASLLEITQAQDLIGVNTFPLDIAAYDLFQLDGLPLLKTPGLPQWPFVSFFVVGSPDEYSVHFDPGAEVSLGKRMALPAVQMPCRCLKRNSAWFEKSDHPLLDNHFSIEYIGEFRGHQISKVTITPFRREKNETFVLKDFTMSIKGQAQAFNFESIWHQEKTGRALFVGPEHLLEAARPLMDYHRTTGKEILTLVYRDESFEQLQFRIRELYHQQAFDSAVIMGDEELVPMERVITSADWSTPSDMNYFTMGGVEDRIPDVVYGRMVASNANQVRSQISKFFEYLESTYRDGHGLTRGVMVSSDEGFNPTDEEYSHAMMAPMRSRLGMNFDFFLQGRRDATAGSILRSLNRGAIWMNYIGHGEGDRWPSITGQALTVDQFSGLTASSVKPIVIDVACQNGRLSFDRRIGERLMNQQNGLRPTGALAYYGGSVDISWHPPAQMAVHINEIAARGEIRELGAILLAGQLKLVELYDDLPSALENIVWYHLQGDPLLELDL